MLKELGVTDEVPCPRSIELVPMPNGKRHPDRPGTPRGSHNTNYPLKLLAADTGDHSVTFLFCGGCGWTIDVAT